MVGQLSFEKRKPSQLICRLGWWISLLWCLSVRSVHGDFHQPDKEKFPDVYVWTDTCNVYVLRHGDAALLIDLGDGSVLEHLHELGIQRVEWVVLTHHHREQCQGAPLLAQRGIPVAAPEGERTFLEQPTEYRRMKVQLSDPHTIHGTSYVRPPIEPIRVARGLLPGETFSWHDWQLRCVATPGNSPAALTYLVERGDDCWAFSGDLMLAGATLHTWFDSEWDYGFAAGIRALRKSVSELSELRPTRMLPSHGPMIADPATELVLFGQKLADFESLYVRGYGAEAAANAYQDKVSQVTLVRDVAQISPHLFKFKRENFWPNFNLILAENGQGLLVDCGLLDEDFLEESLAGLRQHYGLKGIDAVVVSHMHGDHFLQAPYMRAKYGTEIWALDNMVEKMEHPERFDYCAPIQAYGPERTGVAVDRSFRPGEQFTWNGYRFTVDWMPGQTEFALCLHGEIDGRLIAFTGDNIFGDPDDETQTGHEAMVAHNSAILEEGYIQGAELLHRLQPDMLVGGHSFVMNRPAKFIERYRQWSYHMRDMFQALSADPDYEYGFDPYWVRAYPYRSQVAAGETREIVLHVRNFRDRPQRHRIAVVAPSGWEVTPPVIEGELAAGSRGEFPVQIRAGSGVPSGRHILALDVTLDDTRYGQRFDFITEVP